MSVVSRMIGTAERVPLPDLVIRAAVQRLCSRTATRLASGNSESDGSFAEEMAARAGEGRRVVDVERWGKVPFAGVELGGRFDRLDRLLDGSLAIVDYKTGKPPSLAAVREGFSMQLGLLAIIAERGGFEGIEGTARCFEYWSLSRNRAGGFGYVESPVDPKRRDPIPADEFVAKAERHFTEAAGKWLTGDAPFTAKLVPDYAPYAEYDQLMRRDEWYGRD